MELLAKDDISVGVELADGPAQLGCPLALLMDELAHGVLVTTIQGRLLHANLVARRELARKRALEVHQHVLRARAAGDGKVLHDAMAGVARGRRTVIVLNAVDGAMITIAVVPLVAQEPDKPPKIGMLFARPCVCEDPMLTLFAGRNALTATETQVLAILCQGCSAPQVAAQMHLAVSTIRSHVRSLCAKTRSSGVRELVNRVAVLPPLASAFRYQPMH